tara:strand:- start:152 stop:454 length:303 start_codon:yes stop_codon:yes gene_type:complete
MHDDPRCIADDERLLTVDDAVAEPDEGEEQERGPGYYGDAGGVFEDPDVVNLREGHQGHDECYCEDDLVEEFLDAFLGGELFSFSFSDVLVGVVVHGLSC